MKLIYTVEEAKASPLIKNEFIEQYRPFILSRAKSIVKRYANENDDIYSIALIAFNQAIDTYDNSKGPFLPYAEKVIHSREIDFLRSNAKITNEVSFDENSSENFNNPVTSYETNESIKQSERTDRAFIIRQEIIDFNETIGRYGIKISDLPKYTPKAEKTKKSCKEAIRLIIKSQESTKQILETGRLPANYILNNSIIPQKTLERHRIYLLAAVIILKGDYDYLKEYVNLESDER